MGPFSGIAKRTREALPLGLSNQCMCRGSTLLAKGTFKELKFLENFSTITKVTLKTFKKSSQKEVKHNVSPDSLCQNPPQTSVLIECYRHRWTENKKALQGIKTNLPQRLAFT